MKNFVLPGFAEKFSVNQQLVLLYERHPEYFVKDFNFGCFYGCFGYSIWNGGRIFTQYTFYNIEQLIEMRDFYNSRDIPIRLTFTNPLIEEEHLDDAYSNMMAKVLHNGKNEIVTASPILEKYLREKYPNYRYCSSTTKCLLTEEDVLNEIRNPDYFQVCLDYNINHNFKILNQLTPEEKAKTEFLCNAICPSGCSFRKEHYRLNGVFSLNGGQNYRVECPITYNTIHPDTMNYKNNISPEEIESVFEKQGFKHFKLEGRTLPDYELSANYVRYFIKPEYQLYVLGVLIGVQ